MVPLDSISARKANTSPRMASLLAPCNIESFENYSRDAFEPVMEIASLILLVQAFMSF